MKYIIQVLIVILILSACSSNPSANNPQADSTQSMSLQPSDNELPQTDTQVSTQTSITTQIIIIPSETPQSPPPTYTPIPTETMASTLTPTPHIASTVANESTFIADHTTVDKFNSMPASAISAAAARDTLLLHASTGSNIKSIGLDCLAGLQDQPECTVYNQQPSYVPYDNRNWNWQWYDISTPIDGAIGKTDQFVSMVNAQQQNYQVLGMKLCYVDHYNLDFDYYRQAMESLEQTYPQKTFFWATASIISDCNGIAASFCTNIQNFNEQVRTYAQANNKPLYDLADIESHDPNGNLCQSNGFEVLCPEYYDGVGSGGGGHPDVDASVRLAKGFWWLMARLSGWNGN